MLIIKVNLKPDLSFMTLAVAEGDNERDCNWAITLDNVFSSFEESFYKTTTKETKTGVGVFRDSPSLNNRKDFSLILESDKESSNAYEC
jgi:hypothetical protein